MTPVLEFESAEVAPSDRYDVHFEDVTFSLRTGELMLVRLEEGSTRHPFADACQGLVDPIRGRISFCGQDWQDVSPDNQFALRGRIGRVFEGANWVSNLDFDENIMLSQRHHTRRTDGEIADRARALARRFGLDGVSTLRPHRVRMPDRRAGACVRALLGEPQLVILECPTRDAFDRIWGPLSESVRDARARGAAVIWMTTRERIWRDDELAPDLRVQVRGAGFDERRGGEGGIT